MITQTSLMAYFDAKENLGDKQTNVLNAVMTLGKCLNQQVAKYLGWEINRVTGRMNELVKMNKVIEAGKSVNEFNRLVIVWKANI